MPEETAPETVAPELNYQDYKTFRETGKLPATAAEPEKPQPETSEGSEAETPKQPETASESETDEQKQEKEKDESSKVAKRGIEKRFRDLTSEIRELKQQLAAKAEPGVASPKAESEPQVTDFEEYADYVRALSKHTATQAAREATAAATQAQQQKIAVDAWNEREKTVRAKNADYDDVLASVDDIIFPPELGAALRDSELGPQIAYHLAQNRAECERLAKLNPIAAIREIGKLEARLTPATPTPEPPKAPKLSAAPEPIKPVNGSTAASTKRPDQMEYQEYKRYREEQLKLRRA